jgi:hypothetical protein
MARRTTLMIEEELIDNLLGAGASMARHCSATIA